MSLVSQNEDIIKQHRIHKFRMSIIYDYYCGRSKIDLVIPFIKLNNVNNEILEKLHLALDEFKKDLDNKEKYINVLKILKNDVYNKDVKPSYTYKYINNKDGKTELCLSFIQFIKHTLVLDKEGKEKKTFAHCVDAFRNEDWKIENLLNLIFQALEINETNKNLLTSVAEKLDEE